MAGAMTAHGPVYAHTERTAEYGSRASNYYNWCGGNGGRVADVGLTGEVRVPLPDGGEGAQRPRAGPY